MSKAIEIFWAIAAVAWLAAGISAQAREPTLVKTEAGLFYLTVGSDGVPKVSPAKVIDLTGGDQPDDPDDPEVDKELVESVRKWAGEVDEPRSAWAVAKVASLLRAALERGDVDHHTVWAPHREATADALEFVGDADWSEFLKRVDEAITDQRSRGNVGTTKAASRMLASVQVGAEIVASGTDGLTTDEQTKISEMVREAIDE